MKDLKDLTIQELGIRLAELNPTWVRNIIEYQSLKGTFESAQGKITRHRFTEANSNHEKEI